MTTASYRNAELQYSTSLLIFQKTSPSYFFLEHLLPGLLATTVLKMTTTLTTSNLS